MIGRVKSVISSLTHVLDRGVLINMCCVLSMVADVLRWHYCHPIHWGAWGDSRPASPSLLPMNSKQKGKRGELEWAQFLRDMGCPDARRGQQYKGTGDSPDVVGGITDTHCEVKRVERLNLEKAMSKAVDEATFGNVPYVAHRTNNSPWKVTILAADMIRFSQRLATMMGSSINAG